MIALNIVWLANYLIKGIHLAPSTAAWIIVLPSVMQIALAPCLAFLSQRLTKAGYPSRLSRGALGCTCVVIAGVAAICLPLVPFGPLKIFLVGTAFSIASVIFTLGSTLIGEICPSSQRGALLGITNSLHTLAGLIAPVVMGLIVDVGADPVDGFSLGYIGAGLLVATLDIIAAVMIHPQADLRHFRRLGIMAEPLAADTRPA